MSVYTFLPLFLFSQAFLFLENVLLLLGYYIFNCWIGGSSLSIGYVWRPPGHPVHILFRACHCHILDALLLIYLAWCTRRCQRHIMPLQHGDHSILAALGLVDR